MNNMEIIEQEEWTENPRVFDNSGTSALVSDAECSAKI